MNQVMDLPEYIEALLIDAADNTLTPEGLASLELHFQAHPAHRAILPELLVANATLAQLAQVVLAPPQHFGHNVMARAARVTIAPAAGQYLSSKSGMLLIGLSTAMGIGLLAVYAANYAADKGLLIGTASSFFGGVFALLRVLGAGILIVLRQPPVLLLLMAGITLSVAWTETYRRLMKPRRVIA